MTTDIHGLLNGRVNTPAPPSSFVGATASANGATPSADTRDPLARRKNELWAQVVGSSLEREGEGTTLAFEHDYTGVLGGYEGHASYGRYGIVWGFVESDIETDIQSIDTEVSSLIAGGYWHFNLGSNFTLSANILGGVEEYDTQRFINGGAEVAEADFTNVFISPSVNLQYDIPLSNTFHLRPSTSLAYTASFFDSYDESGSSSNLSIDSRSVQTLNTRAQLAAAFVFNRLDLELRVGVDGRFTDADDVDASFAGNSFQFSSTDDDSVNGAYVGLSVKVAASNSFNLTFDTEFRDASGGEEQLTGLIRAAWRF